MTFSPAFVVNPSLAAYISWQDKSDTNEDVFKLRGAFLRCNIIFLTICTKFDQLSAHILQDCRCFTVQSSSQSWPDGHCGLIKTANWWMERQDSRSNIFKDNIPGLNYCLILSTFILKMVSIEITVLSLEYELANSYWMTVILEIFSLCVLWQVHWSYSVLPS